MTEADFIAALRRLPLHRGADGLLDDAALLAGLVVTTDTMVEGIHFLPGDPADDVAWKLVTTNLSDLAAKGARPEGVLLNYPLSSSEWDGAFLAGLAAVLGRFACPLLGGDTVSLPPGAPRVLTVTAFGADGPMPRRGGAREGDALWVAGAIGDAGVGLDIARGADGPPALLAAYRRPQPLIAEGRALGPIVMAMMDVSDGLLIDAGRMAAASGLGVTLALDQIPLSADFRAVRGEDRTARLFAATAGDDYALLFAASPGLVPPVAAVRIGDFTAGDGLRLTHDGGPVPLPERIGYLHAPR